jgi:hypothetical protein
MVITPPFIVFINIDAIFIKKTLIPLKTSCFLKKSAAATL